ncbi:MAG: GNAT family N-acetyltransferase [Actinobacteria bacterium]|nr:GNAT family N-acetyltransferase [Actinomycetota bacterium]
MPTSEAVEQLYALASARPPLTEPADVAEVYATLYDLALDRTDLVTVTAREVGELIGFGYGHPWRWAEQADEWSRELAEELGDEAAGLEDSFAVQLLAVHPSFVRRGLGFELLKQLMVASGAGVHWLVVSDVDSPARRLYRRMGYRPLGRGPEAPNGEPGLVLVHG